MKRLLLTLTILLASATSFAKIPIVTAKRAEVLAEEAIKNNSKLVVIIYADWCQFCKQEEPLLEKVAASLEGKVKFVKLDIDKAPKAVAQTIQALPTQLFVLGVDKQGKPVLIRHEGAFQSAEEILEIINGKAGVSMNFTTPSAPTTDNSYFVDYAVQDTTSGQ